MLFHEIAVVRLQKETLPNIGAYQPSSEVLPRVEPAPPRGANVTDVSQLQPLYEAYQAHDQAKVWNIHVSDKVVSPNTRRGNTRGYGAM